MSEEKLRPVGRIDFLDTKGQTGESCYYYSEEDFLKTVKEENYYGVPMVVNVFRDEDGQTIPLDFVQDFDPLPQGFKILDYKEGEDMNDFRRLEQLANKKLKDAMLFNILSFMNHNLLTHGNTVASIDELYLFLTNMTAIEYIRNASKRVRKKDSAIILASQNIEDFLISGIREFTKPLFSIPTHHFLFNPGNINPREFMDVLQIEQAEYDLIKFPERGTCLCEIITDNTQLTVFGGFAPNSESAQVLSKALGSRTVQSGSVNRGKNDPSQSLQMIERALLTPDELKSLPKGTFVVMKTGFHPMQVKLKLFFKWGIVFPKEIYAALDKGNRKVSYANKYNLEDTIVMLYSTQSVGEKMTEEERATHRPGPDRRNRIDLEFTPRKPGRKPKTETDDDDDAEKGDGMPMAGSNIPAGEETEIIINEKGDIVDERIRNDLPR